LMLFPIPAKIPTRNVKRSTNRSKNSLDFNASINNLFGSLQIVRYNGHHS
jgi:hypothetical protein